MVVSTHSPVVLDVVWALRELRTCKEDIAIPCLKEMFGLLPATLVRLETVSPRYTATIIGLPLAEIWTYPAEELAEKMPI